MKLGRPGGVGQNKLDPQWLEAGDSFAVFEEATARCYEGQDILLTDG